MHSESPRSGISRTQRVPLRMTAMKWIKRLLLLSSGLCTVAPRLEAIPDRILLGEHVFHRRCAGCHGAFAGGENPEEWAGGLKPEGGYWAPALNGSAHAWHHSPANLFDTIKHGSWAADSSMRGFENILADAEICAVIAYLISLWPEERRVDYWNRFREDETCALARDGP